MKNKLIHEAHGQRTFALILDRGDEVREVITQFAREHGIAAAQITAIGAFENAEIRFYDWDAKGYHPIPIQEQVEVVALNGDIAADNSGEPSLHLHAVLGRRDGTAVGGDLKQGRVRPTLEVIITESPTYLRRIKDDETGLSLIKLDA